MSKERIVWRYEKDRSWLYNTFSLLGWVVGFVIAQGALILLCAGYSLFLLLCVFGLADSEYYPFSWGMLLSFRLWLALVVLAVGAVFIAFPAMKIAGAVCSFAFRMGGKHSRILPTVVFVCVALGTVYLAWHFCGGSVAGVVSAILVSAVVLVCYAAMGWLVWRLCSKADNEFYDY